MYLFYCFKIVLFFYYYYKHEHCTYITPTLHSCPSQICDLLVYYFCYVGFIFSPCHCFPFCGDKLRQNVVVIVNRPDIHFKIPSSAFG